jgi:preprotein translocase subunit YajC
MIESIGRGDTVITAGGFFGKVGVVLEDSYIIEVADGVKMRILKSSISVRRDGPDAGAKPADRPRKKRRKKRPDGEPAPLETGAAGGAEAAREDGVTPEESEALIEAPVAELDKTAVAESQREEAAEEKKDE